MSNIVDTLIWSFIGSVVLASFLLFHADKAQRQYDQTISEALNHDYDRTSDNFKYQTSSEQEEAINDFIVRWSGLVSRRRLSAFVESLHEMRILCL